MTQKAYIKYVWLVATTLVLQACATRQSLELPELPDWDTRQAVLSSIEHWEFSGRIGVSTGGEGFNGKLRWAQLGGDFRATVSGPLGVGTVRIEGNDELVALTDKNGEVTELADVELDLQLRYGWTIPLVSLRYWALGLPDPGDPAVTRFDEYGMLSELEQSGWTVSIGEYRVGGGQPMPRRITAENADTRVRLVIDSWLFL